MNTIKAGEGFTIEQVLNSNGFTLDTGEFSDMLEEDDELDDYKRTKLNSEEILKFLSLEEESENIENVNEENVPFVGISFDTIRPKMHSIYENGQVMKLIKREGTGPIVPADAQVTVEYVGYFEYQDEPFDSTYFHRDKKIVLRLGKGRIIEGLEIAIASMKRYEKSLFLIQPNLAYGKLGCLPRIPANAEVLFKVELLDFLDNGAADLYEELSNEEKRKFSAIEKIVSDLMNTAADSFKREKTKQAIREYTRAINYLDKACLENDEEEKKMNKLLFRALTNLTVCYNKVGKPKLACISFQRLQNPSGKAFFQYGKALSQLGDYDEAMKALQKAHKIIPEDEAVRKEIQKVEEMRQKYLEISKRFAQKSLKIVEIKDDPEFEHIANEMCDSFIKDTSAIKKEIPNSLSVQEQECIRRVAASRGLLITKHNRRDDETLYLIKKSYYSKEM